MGDREQVTAKGGPADGVIYSVYTNTKKFHIPEGMRTPHIYVRDEDDRTVFNYEGEEDE